MDIMDIFRHRRSVRIYNDQSVTEEELDKILEAGLNAPTGRNSKCTRFFVISDKEILEKLAESREGATSMLKNASKAILVMGNQAKSDLWVEDASIAGAYMHLCADAIGVGSCWIQVRGREGVFGDEQKYIHQLLGLDERLQIVCILSLGHYDTHPASHDDFDLTRVRYR